jgi:hypothetical protein
MICLVILFPQVEEDSVSDRNILSSLDPRLGVTASEVSMNSSGLGSEFFSLFLEHHSKFLDRSLFVKINNLKRII